MKLTRNPLLFTLNRHSQATIEFTFAMVVIAILIYGLLRIFSWVGMDNAERAWTAAHAPLVQQSDVVSLEQQLNKDVYRSKRLNAFTRKF